MNDFLVLQNSVILLLIISAPSFAHQPVMDMAPRWQGGYGFQVRQQHHYSNTLLSGTSEVDNPLGLEKSVSTTWLEAIYTFRREVRLSIKIPYVDQKRTILRNGIPVQEHGRGVGDIVIGMPLKRYTNDYTSTSNIAFTPSIRLPTGSTEDAFPIGDGSTDIGVSFSASWETADLYQYYDLFYWKNGDGDNGIREGNEIGFDANIGWHPYHNNVGNRGVFLMWDVTARYEARGHDTAGITGGKRLSSGPVFVYYKEGMMIRTEYKYPIYEDVYSTQTVYGPEFNIGIGFVF